jgi:hypothetical protein
MLDAINRLFWVLVILVFAVLCVGGGLAGALIAHFLVG